MHRHKHWLFSRRQSDVAWACSSWERRGYRNNAETTISMDFGAVMKSVQWTRLLGNHQTANSSQNKPIRDTDAMLIEIHWSLRARVIILLKTIQSIGSGLTSPPQPTAEFTNHEVKDLHRVSMRAHTSQLISNIEAESSSYQKNHTRRV